MAAKSQPVQTSGPISDQRGLRAGWAMEDQLPLPPGATEQHAA